MIHNLINKQPASCGNLLVGKMLGLISIQGKTATDQKKYEAPEKEAALSFEAGFAQQSFKSSIRHYSHIYGLTNFNTKEILP